MGKIGDLFVRLGLKSDDYKKGINEAKKETQGFGNTLGKMKAGAVAVWGAIGTAVIKFTKDFIAATNATADKWDEMISGMGAAWHTFLVDLQQGGVKDFIGDFMKRKVDPMSWLKRIINPAAAAEAAKEATKAFDQEFELIHSIRLQRGAIQQELNELYIAMRDTTLSGSDRQAAAAKYKALLQPIADAEVKVYGDMMSKAIDAWQAGTGLNRSKEEILEFFKNVGTQAEAMAAKFPDINDVFQNKKGDKQNIVIFDVVGRYQDAVNMMSNVDRELARTSNSIKATIQRDLESIANAVKTYGQEDLKLDLDIELEVEEIDMSDADAVLNQFIADFQAKQQEIDNINAMIAGSFTQAFSGAVQAITDAAVGIEGAGFEQAIAAFIQPIANMMQGIGEMFMAEGIAELQLISGTPTQKIAAGAALVAVSAAISSGIASLSAAIGGGTGTTASAGSTSPSGGVEKYEQDITIHVVGTISGSDIILAGNKTLNKWAR